MCPAGGARQGQEHTYCFDAGNRVAKGAEAAAGRAPVPAYSAHVPRPERQDHGHAARDR